VTLPLARELEGARQKLLDLTLRNRLLNYRASQLRSIRVTGELPAEIYDALVLREKTLEFRGTGRKKRKEGDVTDTMPGAEAMGAAVEPDPDAAIQRQFETWAPRAQAEVEAKHTDRYLQTPYDDESLARKLFRVYHEGRSAVEEQGYTVAHLALGFLEWFETEDSPEPRRAPLILVPVELERVRAGDFSKVKWTGEDVFANISLQAKLVEHGVALPPFEAPDEKGGIDAWLQQVVEAVAKKPRWRVLSELTLDFFSFTKFVMFKDLDPATWPAERKPEDHPLLQTLFVPQGAPPDEGFDESRIDETLTARDLWHVMDADPSQIAVIEDVKAGRNLVVQGPPGTGKSQTITNLIAEALAAGKSVLFVSEKMAALEVVKARLDGAGLGPFCLELHSRKANKKAVLLELQRALGSKPPSAPAEEVLDEHELLKRELNRLATELGMAVGAFGKTPYQLYAVRQAATARLADDAPALLSIPNAAAVTPADVMAADNALRELEYAMPGVDPVASHPWRMSTRSSMLPHEEEELRRSIARLRAEAREVTTAAAALVEAAGVRQPANLADIPAVTRAAELLARADAPAEMGLLLSSEWNAPNTAAEELLGRLEAFQRDRAALAGTFRDEALEGEHAADAAEFASLSVKFFRFLNGRYRTLRKMFAALYVTNAPKPQQMRADLTRLVELQGMRDILRADARGLALFGARWKRDRSDCAALRAFAEWLVAFRRELLSEALTSRAADIASARVDGAAILGAVQRLRVAAAALRDSADAVLAALCIDAQAALSAPVGELAVQDIDSAAERWQNQLPALFRWSQFNAGRKVLRGTVAAPLEPLISAGRLGAGAFLLYFHAALAESLLRVAFGERASLSHFVGDLHEKKIARFQELDRQLVTLNCARLARRLHAARPQISGGASHTSEVGILLGEMNRKRGHMPIRKLLAKAGGVIQRIKPCFLMSPLSIAQFLDPRSARFDLIVFDEASQVRPEDAVGALLRGSQLVVMGDTRQLPPTSFFDHLAGDDDDMEKDDDSAALTDVESILHQCERSYPKKTLNWHYRSRHESLIAISNLHFYDNKLRVYPSAVDWADELGLHFVRVPHGVYDRGRSSVNRVEAQAVAAAAVEHYRRNPEKSLGIGTFNIKQQQAILEEIEVQLRRYPDMEPLFKSDRRDPFFVKNLETIQGDERDVILISVGYGRDAAGKLSLNFGPLNRDGGERRLNVLISRAREKCVVYSNFTAADLPAEPSTAKGLFALKAFLEYAETRRLTMEEVASDDTDSPFEDAVAEVLRGHGYEVRQQVGCAGFRVDLAVVDPEQRGRYLLGIECDGAKYHSSPVARDRDRLRQQILENLGWRLCRIWSTDWYRNRAEAVDRLLRAVEEAKKAPRTAIAVAATTTPEYASSFTAKEYEEEYAVYDYTPTEEVPAFGGNGEIAITARVLGGEIDSVPAYETCRHLRIPITGELHQVPAESLVLAIEDIVAVETPVHVDEVVRRIRTLWGLQRAGSRIREAMDRAIDAAVRRNIVAREGEFLHLPNAGVRVRQRNGDPPARIDLISDSEIAAALRLVLRSQFATPRGELIDACARRLGIQATSAGGSARIGGVIDAELARGALSTDGDVVRAVG
jgi:very-short-patch-repair endonuclease